jgi:hypothetical protein
MNSLNTYLQTFNRCYDNARNLTYIRDITQKLDKSHGHDRDRGRIVKKLRDLYFLEEEFIDLIENNLKNKREIELDDHTKFIFYYNKVDEKPGIMDIDEALIQQMIHYYSVLKEYLKSGLFNVINPHMRIKPITIQYFPFNINFHKFLVSGIRDLDLKTVFLNIFLL